MLTLENFRKEISPTILKRGREYFHSKKVIKLTQKNERLFDSTVYEATVQGTKNTR